MVPAPALLLVETLGRPKSLEAAVDHFSRIGLVRPGIALPTWEQAWAKTHKQAKAHALAHRVPEIDAYGKELGIEQETLVAAIGYALWSATAEYRLLASKGIIVDQISARHIEPYLGRGRMPVIEEVLLSDLAGMRQHAHDQVAWPKGQTKLTVAIAS